MNIERFFKDMADKYVHRTFMGCHLWYIKRTDVDANSHTMHHSVGIFQSPNICEAHNAALVCVLPETKAFRVRGCVPEARPSKVYLNNPLIDLNINFRRSMWHKSEENMIWLQTHSFHMRRKGILWKVDKCIFEYVRGFCDAHKYTEKLPTTWSFAFYSKLNMMHIWFGYTQHCLKKTICSAS